MADSKKVKASEDISDQVGGKKKLCEPCLKKKKNTKPELYCITCQQYQCKECVKAHDVYGFMSDHKIVKENEAPSKASGIDLKGLDICRDHNEQFKFFCDDHKELCCQSCSSNSHKNCKAVKEIFRLASGQKMLFPNVDSGLASVKKDLKQFIATVEKTDFSIGELESQYSIVDAVRQMLITKCDELKATVTEQFRKAEKMAECKKSSSLSTLQNISKEVDAKCAVIESVKKNGTPEQKFIAKYAVEKDLSNYNTQLKDQRGNMFKYDCNIKYNEALREILETGASLAAFYVGKTPIDPSFCASEKVIKLKLVTTIDAKPSQDEKREPLYSGMDFFPDGRLAVVDNLNHKVHVMDQILEKRGVIRFNMSRLGLVVVSEKEMAVTSAFAIDFLHVTKNSSISLIRTIKTSASYCSISMMTDTKFLVGTVQNRRPLRMITTTGEETDFGNLPEKTYSVDSARSTYIRSKNTAVLTDRLENVIYFGDVDENLVTRQYVMDQRIKQPRGVCVGPEDCLFVCSAGTDSIVQLSSSGKVINSQKLNMTHPYTICISKDGRKMVVGGVSNQSRKILQLFDCL